MNRRGFLACLGAAAAAPALPIVDLIPTPTPAFSLADYERLVLQPFMRQLAENVSSQIMLGDTLTFADLPGRQYVVGGVL